MKDVSQMTAEEVEAEVDRRVADYPMPEARKYDIPGLPAGEVPLTDFVKFPKEMEFTEQIGNTEYTVKARFRPSGRDLLCTLHRLLGYGVAGNEKIDSEDCE